MITISNKADALIQELIKNDATFTGRLEQIFEMIDTVHGGVIPQQDLGDGTYEWVCDYAGAKFYARVDNEDSLWFPQGI
jgi:hypothetical protein